MKAMEKLSYNWRIEKREAKRDGKQQKQKEMYPWKNIKIKHFIFSKWAVQHFRKYSNSLCFQKWDEKIDITVMSVWLA